MYVNHMVSELWYFDLSSLTATQYLQGVDRQIQQRAD